MGLAASYDEANQFPAAVAMFERAHAQLVALGRENTEAAGATLQQLGRSTLHLMGQTLKAEELLRKAIRISSADGTDKKRQPHEIRQFVTDPARRWNKTPKRPATPISPTHAHARTGTRSWISQSW